MSTDITSLIGCMSVNMHGGRGTVSVTLDADGAYPNTEIVNRADFLAAVAAECDVIIIDRAELPPAYITEMGDVTTGDEGSDVYDVTLPHRRIAMRHLAMAEYLTTHPPVDEADVQELAGLVEIAAHEDGVSPDECHPSIIARYLLRTGRVEVKR